MYQGNEQNIAKQNDSKVFFLHMLQISLIQVFNLYISIETFEDQILFYAQIKNCVRTMYIEQHFELAFCEILLEAGFEQMYGRDGFLGIPVLCILSCLSNCHFQSHFEDDEQSSALSISSIFALYLDKHFIVLEPHFEV